MLIAYTLLRRWMREMAAHVRSSPSASASIPASHRELAGGYQPGLCRHLA